MNVYSTARNLRSAGVIGHLNDMTPETAFIKLAWLLSNYSKEESKKLQKMCFDGIGGISAPDAQFDPAYTASLCDAAAVSRKELTICRASAAYRMSESPDVEAALKVCQGLTGKSFEYCESWARLDFSKGYEIAEELDI